jgi:REP element-mobilizing transposase RayT
LEHSTAGEDYEKGMPGLEQSSLARLKEEPIVLTLSQAEQLLDQLKETALHRKWSLLAVSIMFNHLHLVVGISPTPGKKEILRDFKSYGSRRLNRQFGTPASGTWWTDSGSCRPVRNIPSAVFYICHRQPSPLLVWSCERGRIPTIESYPDNVFTEEFVFESES